MELLDYAKFRWKALATVFVLGLVVIAVLASGALLARSQYTATAQVLIRPPSSQLSLFSYDLDRYIDTEIATLYSDSALRSEASGTPLSPGELKDALSTTHSPGSDIVGFVVKTPEKAQSVEIANHVARVYLKDARARADASNDRSLKYLQNRIEEERATLQQADRRLSRSLDRAGADTADPVLINPQAYSQQQISTTTIQQLQQEMLKNQSSSTSSSLSRVLSGAQTAEPAVRPWRINTILAAVVGLLLALAALAAIALSFSKRIVSIDRWNNATAGSRLRPAIRGRSRSQRPSDLRRILNDIRNAGASGPVSVVAFPVDTKRTRSTIPDLVDSLEASGVPCWSTDRELVGAGGAAVAGEDGLTVAVVDLFACRVEDAAILADGNPAELTRFVPVLI